MKTSLRLLTSASACLLAGALAPAAHAQVVTPNPAPTIITTAPYTINAPGYYQLGADLIVSNTTGNIITINAGNVTLDFGGHFISGPVNTATTLNGVYATEQGNLTIRNGTIAYCAYGIFLTGNNSAATANINQRVNNMLITYCYSVGVYYRYTRNSDVLDSRISYIGGSTALANNIGVYLNQSTGAKIKNNEISFVTNSSSGGVGVYTSMSATSFEIDNTLTSCDIGLYQGHYQNNLFNSCAITYEYGTDGGQNN